MTGVTRIMRPGATLSLLLSVTDRDSGLGVRSIHHQTMNALQDAYREWDLTVTEARPATPAEIKAAHSSWAKRLGAGHKRPTWLLRATRRAAHCMSPVVTTSQSERPGR
jgi:16S rRNA (adenine(1408)-N(1))-methyltransferase